MMHVLQNDESIDDLLDQHRAVLEHEFFVQSHTWSEVETRYPSGPPLCGCIICQQLEEFSDKLVTVMREMRIQDNFPEDDEPRMTTLMHDLVTFAGAADTSEFESRRSELGARSWGSG